jgi:hypothetical protein
MAGAGGTAGAGGGGGGAGASGAGGGGVSDGGLDAHEAGAGGSGGAPADAGADGAAGCGGALCTSTQVCVHPQCVNCICLPPGTSCPQPKPFCADVPASCGGAPKCSCFPFTVCAQNGGACMSVGADGISCG